MYLYPNSTDDQRPPPTGSKPCRCTRRRRRAGRRVQRRRERARLLKAVQRCTLEEKSSSVAKNQQPTTDSCVGQSSPCLPRPASPQPSTSHGIAPISPPITYSPIGRCDEPDLEEGGYECPNEEAFRQYLSNLYPDIIEHQFTFVPPPSTVEIQELPADSPSSESDPEIIIIE